jgi:four helix bundle protein
MAEKVKSYKELKIWQKAIALVKFVYQITQKFPREERYVLTDQVRRAAISIPSNIAEGQTRQHTAEFRQFLFISLGSLAELDTQLILAKELGYMNEVGLSQFDSKSSELRKMIWTLISRLT